MTDRDLTPAEAMMRDYLREQRDVEEGRADYEKHRDLTPDEARAEIEAFLGEHWAVRAEPYVGDEGMPSVRALRSGGVEMCHVAITYRAAVSALKQAWRDAVRPWVVKAGNAWDMDMTDEWNAREVLGGDL